MQLSKKIDAVWALITNPKNLFCRTRHIHILSHMRSRSSVLSHILGSNPEICGYSELGISYADRGSLFTQRVKLNREFKDFRGKYLLDKILHNRYGLPDHVVRSKSPKVIILLREPQSTLRSMLKMAGATGNDSYKDPNYLLNYYCSRLSHLENFAKEYQGQYFFIESDKLLENTEEILTNLSTWLGLDTKLDKNYSQFQRTGTAGYGDFSSNIATGVLRKTKQHDDVLVPKGIVLRAESCYEQCRRILERNEHQSSENQK